MSFEYNLEFHFPSSIRKGKYKHYKGGLYEVIGVAKHSETEEDYVIYFAIESPQKVWIRPLKMFLESIRVHQQSVKRFEFID